MTWQCFLVAATKRQRHWLRRYSMNTCTCPHGYHNAMVQHGADTVVEEFVSIAGEPTEAEKIAMPWPKTCDCGYVFSNEDTWQRYVDPIYAAPDGRSWPMRELPPGAILEAPWLDAKPVRSTGTYDGPQLLVVLPGVHKNMWNVTGPSRDGPGWIVNGKPPLLTVSPSISTRQYHGFLVNGVLSPDVDGRKFDV